MQNLLSDLTTLLEKDERLVFEGQILKNKVVEMALGVDAGLIKLLLSHKDIRRHFFTEVDGIAVFDKIKFQQFVMNKQFLPDSFTAYKNKIGLTANGQFLTDSKEVVLVWPYKDCVLEGGQDKEDAKRDEVFWNETLAPDQIDRLLSPKVLTNFKKYDKNGEHKVKSISRSENLIIKGNNLLALHTLEKIYSGRVKLIYIDPPFNTDDDSFRYNDRFSHSTWLTFMHNRLDIAKKLLSKDGAIFVHLDHGEAPYCKVLMDEVFGRENWLNTFSVTTNDASGFKATGKSIFSTANQIFLYAKNKPLLHIEKQYIENEYDSGYNQVLLNRSAPISEWKFESIAKVVAQNLGFASPSAAKKQINDDFDVKVSEFALSKADHVFQTVAISGGARQKRLATIEKSLEDRGCVYQHPNDDISDFYILNGRQIVFYEDRIVEIDGQKIPAQLLTDVWTDIKVNGIGDEGGVKLKNGKKPERLLKRIIDMTTSEGELVLDFFAGSGATAAVAHKMKRQYICIEQMDYTDDITLQRLKNVVNGDKTGISSIVDWQGGGSFLYCELSKVNQTFVEEIEAAKTPNDLQKIWESMQERAFLSYRANSVKPDSEEFKGLTLSDQKKVLLEILDKNMLYIPYSEMDDKTYDMSAEDKNLNRQLHEGGQ